MTVGPLIKRLFPARRRVHRATPTDLLTWGAALHLIVDWLTQNEWVAEHKHRLVHPAGYVHAGSHAAAQALVFPVPIAVALGGGALAGARPRGAPAAPPRPDASARRRCGPEQHPRAPLATAQGAPPTIVCARCSPAPYRRWRDSSRCR